MEALKMTQVFLIEPKEEAMIEPNTFVHCNMIPKDNSKFALQFIGEKPDEELKDVESILYPTKAIVITPGELVSRIEKIWAYLIVKKTEANFKPYMVQDYIYDFLFSQEEEKVTTPAIPIRDEELSSPQPTTREENPFRISTPNPSKGEYQWTTGINEQLRTATLRTTTILSSQPPYEKVDVADELDEDTLESIADLRSDNIMVSYLNKKYVDGQGQRPNKLRVRVGHESYILYNGTWKRLQR